MKRQRCSFPSVFVLSLKFFKKEKKTWRRVKKREKEKIPRIELLNSYSCFVLCNKISVKAHPSWASLNIGAQFIQKNFSFPSPRVGESEWVKPTLLLLHFWCGSRKKFSLIVKKKLRFSCLLKSFLFYFPKKNCQLSTFFRESWTMTTLCSLWQLMFLENKEEEFFKTRIKKKNYN